MNQVDWDPAAYGRFRDLRLRPALDLLAQVGELPKGDVIDLGCGNGAVAADLRKRWPDRTLRGVDGSAAMLAKAKASGHYDVLDRADVAEWAPATPPALIFSNALLHWLPDHDLLMPRLAAMLTKGGVLAVQMPRQWKAPSHRFLRDIAASLFPDRFDATQASPSGSAVRYWEMLAPLGEVTVWETEYVQRLEPEEEGHPVRAFTQSTIMRPYLEGLDKDEAAAFIGAYDKALAVAYPVMADGASLLPFRRVFFVLVV